MFSTLRIVSTRAEQASDPGWRGSRRAGGAGTSSTVAGADGVEELARVADGPGPTETGVLPRIVEAEPRVSLNAGSQASGVGSPSISPSTPSQPASKVVLGRRPRVRRVTRVVRHVDTWSVFKVALVFNVVLYGVCLTAGVLLWNVAHATGTIDNIEQFFEQFGWSEFQFKGGEIFHNAWIGGLFVVIGLTGFAVLVATMFNLITDLVGGIRVSVLEEEVVARSPRNG
jgi:hypothetical protein